MGQLASESIPRYALRLRATAIKVARVVYATWSMELKTQWKRAMLRNFVEGISSEYVREHALTYGVYRTHEVFETYWESLVEFLGT